MNGKARDGAGGRRRAMTPENLKKLQATELDLLFLLDRLCRENGISYMICGGTALGALRHHGFIPWDDDVDVAMLRSEYEKFAAVCARNFSKGGRYFLQDFRTDANYRWGYAKLLNTRTVWERPGHEQLKMRKHICIDIFILDGAPASRLGYRLHAAVCFCIRKILWSPAGRFQAGNSLLRAWYGLLSLIPRKASETALLGLAKMFPEKNAKFFRPLTWPGGPFPRAWVTELTEAEFEGRKLYASAHADAWLRFTYGDYMQLPPPAERRGTNTVVYYRLEDEAEMF